MPLIKFPPSSLDLHGFLTCLTYSAIIIIIIIIIVIIIIIIIIIIFIFIFIFILIIITIRTSNNLDRRAD